ncbi:hypothetical protein CAUPRSCDRAFT_12672 [Caulochytrium protostelioides]|uniref:Uncharacterized protein n=1 Tax=Caulochytrium protostelioides TaxID=1555241 RepID=A0A4P9WUA7_9FUNG|nr:hypothetical protein CAUPRSCDRAFT_12672 [Caulochytrium protostelioides]
MLLLSRPNGVLLVMFVLAVCQLVMGESIDQTEIVRDSPMHLPASETLKSRADAKPTRNLLNLLAYRSSRYVDHVHVLTLEHLRGSNVPRLSSKNTKLMDAETIKYLDKYTANELAKSAYQEVMNPDRNNRDLLYLRAYVGKLGNQSPSSALTSTQIKKARAITHAIDLAVAKDLLTKHMHLKAFKKELAEWSEFFNYLHFVMLRKESLSTKNLEAQSASDRATAEKKLALLSVLFLSSVDIRVAIEFLHRIPHPETHDPEIHHSLLWCTINMQSSTNSSRSSGPMPPASN